MMAEQHQRTATLSLGAAASCAQGSWASSFLTLPSHYLWDPLSSIRIQYLEFWSIQTKIRKFLRFFGVLTCVFHLSNLLSWCAVLFILPWTWMWKMAMLEYTLRGGVLHHPCWKGGVKPRLILLIVTYQGITLTSELTEQTEFSKLMWCWQDVPTLQP